MNDATDGLRKRVLSVEEGPLVSAVLTCWV